MSKQTTFTLTFLAGLSVIVPGCAGYLSARMDAVERAHRELVSLESRIRQEQLTSPVAEAEDSPARFRNETVAVPGVTLCGPGKRPQAENRREREAGTLADGVRTPDAADAASDGRPGIVSGARVSASAGASVTEAAQARAAEREQRRRHRQERLCAAAPGEPAADAPTGTSDSTSDGAPADSVSGPSQAEAPAN
ncbi:hypothetical protein ACFYY8_14955 [Streptosporangium sp. NPDC001559]|uniref:hypothetical protein n=1 Tax=Streptosporangium sp. NPDC001559 TaxID=3366187 RepID=UPI0036F0050D